jgi:acyl-CoA synthetase (AMP-forming)/AMP-acid ligase II
MADLALASSPVHNIAGLLEQRASERPDQRAVVFPSARDPSGRVAWTQLTFAQLDTLTDEIARGLVARGARRGDRVSVLVRPCLEFIPIVFALFKMGAIPLMIDPGMGRAQFLACLRSMVPRVLIAESAVHALRPLAWRSFRSVEIGVSMGRGWWGALPLSKLRAPGERFPAVAVGADDEAAILFTSGSTGPAKGVTYTHGIFATQTRLIGELMGIEPGEIDLACFPLFGLFSMALGMTVVIPDMDPTKPAQVDPARIVEAIDTHGCTSASGSPAIWKRVGPYCAEQDIRLPSLRRVLTFGAPIPVSLHETFRAVLREGAEVHTPYGATECLPVANIATREVLGEAAARTRDGAGTCVGRPVTDAKVRIVPITDEPLDEARALPAGEVGEITVAGPMVTPEYKNDPVATRAAKIATAEGLRHRMGDVGYLDADGRLWFCGRKSHRVTLADGRVLFPVQVEGILNDVPGVARTALVGVDGAPVLCVELARGALWSVVEAMLRARAAEHPLTRAIGRFLAHPGFPVDVRHNAKIDRLRLGSWAAGQKR